MARKLMFLIVLAALILTAAMGEVRAALVFSEETRPVTVLDEEANEVVIQVPLWVRDANGLMLQPCLDQTTLCLQVNDLVDPPTPIAIPEEFFYYMAAAEIPFDQQPGATDPGSATIEIAIEGFAPEAPEEGEEPGAPIAVEIILGGRGFAPNSVYTFTHPFGVNTVTTDEDGRAVTVFLENPAAFHKFLYPRDVLPITNEDGTYLADPFEHNAQAVFGSPVGRNVFRVSGPGIGELETDQFEILGKVFTEGATLAANPVIAGTAPGTPVVIDVLAGVDTTIVPAIPTRIVLGEPTAGTVALKPEFDKVRLLYTPGPTTPTGPVTFTYDVTTFSGATAGNTVTVIIEDLQIDKAEYRPKVGKWKVSGSTTNLVDNVIRATIGPRAFLSGSTTAAGHAFIQVTYAKDAINYSLRVRPLPESPITAAHIHMNAPMYNDPAVFFLCGGSASPCINENGTLNVTGTLNENDLIPPTVQGYSFFDVVQAIMNGQAYVNVHTEGVPAGEIRGDIVMEEIGQGVISLEGGWSVVGKSAVSPGPAPGKVTVQTPTGLIGTIDLKVR
jgi:hypothetical protein